MKLFIFFVDSLVLLSACNRIQDLAQEKTNITFIITYAHKTGILGIEEHNVLNWQCFNHLIAKFEKITAKLKNGQITGIIKISGLIDSLQMSKHGSNLKFFRCLFLINITLQ